MLPKQFRNPQRSLNPVTACVHISSVGVSKCSGCKTFQSSWQTPFTMLETVDRPTRKEKAMVWWLSPVAKYLKQEFKIMYTVVLCGALHDILCFVIVCVTVQIYKCDKKSIKPFSFSSLIFSYFWGETVKQKWKNLRDSCMKYKRFLKSKTWQATKKYEKRPWSRHLDIICNKPTRCNSGSIVFINNYKYAVHVSDALCVHHQEHYKL